MKTCVYLTNPKAKALCEELGKTNDIGVMFDKVDHELKLPHDDLARAMYVAIACGTDKANVATLLWADAKRWLKDAVAAGEIDSSYLARWN